MSKNQRSPVELRSMFGANLRQLAQQYPSISELSRRLGINRTQLNRYLTGESFPRPDILDRICSFFDVDARILLDPVDQLATKGQILQGPELADFLGAGITRLTDDFFPSGLYRFVRRSFVRQDRYVQGLVYVFRRDGVTYVRGYEARAAMLYQGLPVDARSREFRGLVTSQDDGVAFLIARRGSVTATFNYLTKVPTMEGHFWSGYLARTTHESDHGDRVARMLYEYLGQDTAAVLRAARSAGFLAEQALTQFERRLLNPGRQFR
ncbi:helix-turn-helix domain-containing protein [Phaeobacter italicus]|uniref:helix-turn-helix domain-containing protein n=1 Tax=Phaeobacter italicus TaxID=481446 RepID=UPI00232CBA08|nr:helix-turn-helix transcriptional regulator [Phaeobacter italicus]MEE2816125.1 helix-turn-helix transcriptional regulator [Pseudomonadota bacterium]